MNLLIIFVKNPVAGEVKTRLAAEIGNEKALEIYQKLLLHTRKISAKVATNKRIYYGNAIPENDIWSEENYTRFPQKGADLGEKMANAFTEGFGDSYKKIVLIGSDCMEISSEIIEEAFEVLEKYDCVLGPAKDGGYYLIGMKKMNFTLFQNKAWSTSQVLQQTLADLENMHLHNTYQLLIPLNDIDTLEDWQRTININN